MCSPISTRQLAHDLRAAGPGRGWWIISLIWVGQVMPQLRLLALHDPLDDPVDVAAGGVDDLLGDLLGIELLEELLRGADLGDPAVDGQAAHLRRPRGHDPLPADPADHHAGDLAHLVGQQPRDGVQPRRPHALEVDGIEQHQHAGPVGDVADHAGEHGTVSRASVLWLTVRATVSDHDPVRSAYRVASGRAPGRLAADDLRRPRHRSLQRDRRGHRASPGA